MIDGIRFGAYCRRIRDWPAFALMSERITLSPGCSPSKTSIVFTDMRPNRTFTFVACMPSESILNRLPSPFAAPKTGRSIGTAGTIYQ